ncbi:MAG: type II secretion system protein [Xanthomonadaceae bacterium]|nr:type II secretion system protein [Xanthomonadaceae bacterium]
MKSQNGFTLIELVIVIVLLGVLAAIAVPRFINLQDDALLAQRTATAAAITSAMNINFAACALNNHAAGGDCLQVDNCDDAASVLQNGLPAGYTVTAAPIAAPNGTAASCTIARANVAGTTTFTGVRAGMP